MGRRQPRNRLPPFVPLTWETLHSEAYKRLPPSAAKLLPYFLGKVQLNVKDPGYHTTTFPFTYSEAKNYGCARRTFYGVVSALIAHGFVDPVKRGGLRGMNMTASVFRLSDRWRHFGTPAFAEKGWATFGAHQIASMVQGGSRCRG